MPNWPKEIVIGRQRLWDVRHLFPDVYDAEGKCSVALLRNMTAIEHFVMHHDGVLMAPGDTDYDGTTWDEDLLRLQAIYQQGLHMGWGGFPYHFVESPNGRGFYTRDVKTFGAQVAGKNHISIGIALMGLFFDCLPKTEQLCAGARSLLAGWYLFGRLVRVDPHLYFGNTDCPGNTHRIWIPTMLSYASAIGNA